MAKVTFLSKCCSCTLRSSCLGLGVGGVQSSRTNVSGGETVGLEKHLKRKLYVWAHKEKHRTARRITLQDTIVTMKYHWVCWFC